jgi:uncharacterized protein
MSSSNIQIVQAAYAAFGRGNIPAFLALLSPEVEWTLPGDGLFPQAGTHRGHGGVTRFLQILAETMDFLAFEPREFFATGDRVVALGWYHLRVKQTQRAYEAHWAMAFTIREGKVTQFREYLDTAAEALAYGTVQRSS